MHVSHSSHVGTWRRRIWVPPPPLFPGTCTPGTFQYPDLLHFDNTRVFQPEQTSVSTLCRVLEIGFRTWDLRKSLTDVSSEQVLLLTLFPLALSRRDGCTQERQPAVALARSQAELYMTSPFSGLGWKHRRCYSTSLSSSSDTSVVVVFFFFFFLNYLVTLRLVILTL